MGTKLSHSVQSATKQYEALYRYRETLKKKPHLSNLTRSLRNPAAYYYYYYSVCLYSARSHNAANALSRQLCVEKQ